MHLGRLESTPQAKFALGDALNNSYNSLLLSYNSLVVQRNLLFLFFSLRFYYFSSYFIGYRGREDWIKACWRCELRNDCHARLEMYSTTSSGSSHNHMNSFSSWKLLNFLLQRQHWLFLLDKLQTRHSHPLLDTLVIVQTYLFFLRKLAGENLGTVWQQYSWPSDFPFSSTAACYAVSAIKTGFDYSISVSFQHW